jgi:PAS domain S-box-containing protein
MLGRAEQELLGLNWVDTCLPARTRDELRKKFLNLIGGDLSIVEGPILNRSGEERLIEWRNTVLRDDAERVIGTFSSGVDLTDRKHAQYRLQSAALNAAANAIVITDRAGLVQWANPAFSDLTGYTGAEAVGRNPWELVNSDQHDQALYEDLWETILTGQVWRGEIINRRKDGSLYIEEQAVTPVRNAQGEISHLIAVKQDITERKVAEEETRQQAQLSALGAAVGLSLNETDSLAHALQHCADALITHLDAAFARIWTFDERDGVLELQASAGLSTHVTGPHGRVPIGQFTIGRIARDRKAYVTNTVIGDPEVEDQVWARREEMVAFAGHPLVVDEHLVGVMTLFARDALSDTVVAALASVSDHIALGIERHRSAAALRSAEERMRFALQNADVGIWDMDYTTGVLRWSETMEAHYGLEPGTFGGTFAAFVERIHPDDRESLMETVRKAMKSGLDFRVEHRSIWPDGTVRWLSGAGRVHLGEHSEPVRGVGISLDVTPWRKLELELRHAQKLESVGRLASGVAHEINTPMQFVSDSVHFVQDAMADLVDVVTKYRAVNELVLADLPARSAAGAATQAEQEMDLDYVLANVPAALDRSIEGLNRVTVIVQSMKDFAHPGRTEMAAVDLNRAIQSTLTIARNEYKYVADVETDFGDIPLVMCYGGDVNQAFLNIIVNAAHAIGGTTRGTEARGRIVIQTRVDGDDVVVRISDSGGGIPEAIRDQVFDPFFTTKDVGKGTGQGLAIARAVIVEKHSGDLSFETEMGHGSTFVIRLPIDVRSRAGVEG